MRNLLVFLIAISPGLLTAQVNTEYNPDFDGDGCYSIADILGLLPLFGTCAPAAFQCGDSVLFDAHWYNTVSIGNQCWFAENLRTTVFRNGDLIPGPETGTEWDYTDYSARTTVYGYGEGACSSLSPEFDACNDILSLEEYGRLYNWYAVDDIRGLCPEGWHVPADSEWAILEDHLTSLGFGANMGIALATPTGWSDGMVGTDNVGFSALPGGRFQAGLNDLGTFSWGGGDGYWWSSTTVGGLAWARYIYSTSSNLLRWYDPHYLGYSVR